MQIACGRRCAPEAAPGVAQPMLSAPTCYGALCALGRHRDPSYRKRRFCRFLSMPAARRSVAFFREWIQCCRYIRQLLAFVGKPRRSPLIISREQRGNSGNIDRTRATKKPVQLPTKLLFRGQFSSLESHIAKVIFYGSRREEMFSRIAQPKPLLQRSRFIGQCSAAFTSVSATTVFCNDERYCSGPAGATRSHQCRCLRDHYTG